MGQSFFHVVGLGGVLDRLGEQIDVIGQRVLIHRVDVGQVRDSEEQVGCLFGHRQILSTSMVNLFFGFFGNLLFLGNFIGLGFGGLEHFDTFFVLENVGGIGQDVQDLVLDVSQSFLVVRTLDDQSFLLLFELGLLLFHKDTQ
jgi:hypothetical protein